MSRGTPSYVTVTGRFSDEEKATMAAMADRGKTAGTIARKLGRHPSTVYYHLNEMGYRTTDTLQNRSPTYMRNGRVVHTFPPEEDDLLRKLRMGGATYSAIARACTERFGRPRRMNAVRARLNTLAALEAKRDGD